MCVCVCVRSDDDFRTNRLPMSVFRVFPDPLKNKLWLFALWLEFIGYFLSFAICLI